MCHYQILTIYSDESTYITNRIKPYKLEQKAAEEQLRMTKKWQLSLDIMPNIAYIRMYLAHPSTLLITR